MLCGAHPAHVRAAEQHHFDEARIEKALTQGVPKTLSEKLGKTGIEVGPGVGIRERSLRQTETLMRGCDQDHDEKRPSPFLAANQSSDRLHRD